jgi:hypothetical protein
MDRSVMRVVRATAVMTVWASVSASAQTASDLKPTDEVQVAVSGLTATEELRLCKGDHPTGPLLIDAIADTDAFTFTLEVTETNTRSYRPAAQQTMGIAGVVKCTVSVTVAKSDSKVPDGKVTVRGYQLPSGVPLSADAIDKTWRSRGGPRPGRWSCERSPDAGRSLRPARQARRCSAG